MCKNRSAVGCRLLRIFKSAQRAFFVNRKSLTGNVKKGTAARCIHADVERTWRGAPVCIQSGLVADSFRLRWCKSVCFPCLIACVRSIALCEHVNYVFFITRNLLYDFLQWIAQQRLRAFIVIAVEATNQHLSKKICCHSHFGYRDGIPNADSNSHLDRSRHVQKPATLIKIN